ncbi:hypothetical protein, partial [Pseudomonas oryzihabitans]|uniref:hypothetical protein n=1 Tax=Pseudomonas oryzihabitans TaxID=47885 RepID=UPI002B1D2D57
QKTPGKNSIPVVITKVDKYGSSRSFLGTTVYIDKNKIEQVKAEKSAAPKQRNSQADYQATAKKEFTETIWPRLEFISKIDVAPEKI